jgi:hypothetical protein
MTAKLEDQENIPEKHMPRPYFRNRYAPTSMAIAVIGLTLVLTGAAVAQQLPTGTGAGQALPPKNVPAATKLPVATSPGVTPPPAPGSARTNECRKMAAEMGLGRTRRARYIETCSRR